MTNPGLSLHVIVIAHPLFLVINNDAGLVASIVLKVFSLLLKHGSELVVVSPF